jgi:hypothetical protein
MVRRQKSRDLWNSGAIRALLVKHFPSAEIVDFFGGLNLLDTALAFGRSDLIVGPHGAGWSNLVFSLPGAVCIEMLSLQHVNIMYAHHAQIYGMRHYFTTTDNGRADEAKFEHALMTIKGQSKEQREADIEEGIRRRLRYDDTCVTELEEEEKAAAAAKAKA